MLLPTQVDALAAGAFLAIMAREKDARARLSALSPWALLVSGLGLLVLILRTGYAAYWTPDGWANSRSNLALFSLMAVFFTSLIAVSISSNSPLKTALEPPWLRRIGKISYGLYLYHYPIFVIADLIENDLVGGKPPLLYYITEIIVTIGLTYLLASVSWKWFETPILKYKDRFL
jgi:peptidoglycan/LPS O-acetylase OafA/YrhL